jgi:ribosomal protein L11 methyltransferase
MQPSTIVARLTTDERTARRLLDQLAECLDPERAAVSAFETLSGWTVAIHFRATSAHVPAKWIPVRRQEHAPTKNLQPFPDRSEIECEAVQPEMAVEETALRALVALAAGQETADAVVFEEIAATDWVTASLAGLAPVAVGRFLVHGRHDRARVKPNHIGIEIEAALAFGTGHHGTTRGCLEALDRFAKLAPVRRARVLDVGTGTGVLAIAAAKALRARVIAGEIDPVAVRVARGNIARNGVARFVDVISADGVAPARFRARAPYDLVFANILLRPLKRLARPLARLVAPDARLVLSGLAPMQAQAAIAAYRAQGLALERRLQRENWLTLVLRRPARRLPRRVRPK